MSKYTIFLAIIAFIYSFPVQASETERVYLKCSNLSGVTLSSRDLKFRTDTMIHNSFELIKRNKKFDIKSIMTVGQQSTFNYISDISTLIAMSTGPKLLTFLAVYPRLVETYKFIKFDKQWKIIITKTMMTPLTLFSESYILMGKCKIVQ